MCSGKGAKWGGPHGSTGTFSSQGGSNGNCAEEVAMVTGTLVMLKQLANGAKA